MEYIVKNRNFRIKKMNAIELLAIQSQASFEDLTKTEQFFYLVLEKTEVEIKGQWLPVKEKNKNIFYPKDVEQDVDTIKELISHFTEYLKDVFLKSNESNT